MAALARLAVYVVYSLPLYSASAETIQLPNTGQETCYNASGTTVSCKGTGQDGELRSGILWPNPRFIDGGNGLIQDSLTGLFWLKDASTPTIADCTGGSKSLWADAFSYVTCLNKNNYRGHNDWRVPNKAEFESLKLVAEQNAIQVINSSGFNLQSNTEYWSSSTISFNSALAWTFVAQDNMLSVGATWKAPNPWASHPLV